MPRKPKATWENLDDRNRQEADAVEIFMAAMRKLFADGTPITSAALTNFGAGEYETVAASQSDQAIGATGATGDYLSGLLIVPATTAAGAVSIKDGSGSPLTVFAGGGTTALTTLIPFFVPLGIKSASGAWKVTTGANVSVIAVGNFT